MLRIIVTAVVSFIGGFFVAMNIDWHPAIEENQNLVLKKVEQNSPKMSSVKALETKNKNEPVNVPELASESSMPHSRKRLFHDDRGVKVETILNEKLEKGEVQSESGAPNNGRYTKEKLSDGTIVNREFDNEGKLIGESRKYEDSEANKSFFDNGQTKGAKIKFADGSTISVSYDLSGTITARKDKLPNGDQIAWDFNDYGDVTRRWLIRKNQKPVLFE